MTETFTPGQVIIIPGGRVEIVRRVLPESSPKRLQVYGSRTTLPLAERCTAVTKINQVRPDTRCDAHGWRPYASRAGYVVECHCTRTYGGSHWVKTPCCDGGRRGVRSGETVECPECNWYWTPLIAPRGTLWVSKGHGKTLKRHRKAD